MFKFGNSSKEKLEGVHEDLQTIMYEAIKLSPIDFGITEGMRSLERAEQLQKEGASKVGTKSKHCQGKAIDIVVDIKIRWGGSWETGNFTLNRDMSFIDAVHFELVE